MLVHFNPHRVLHLLNTVQTANHDIADAQNLLRQVTAHNDWQCSERSRINENTNVLKTRMNKLSTNTSNFTRAVTNSISNFNVLEQQIPKRFSSIDSIIGRIRKIAVDRAQPFLTAVHSLSQRIIESNGGVSKIVWNAINSSGINTWRWSDVRKVVSPITTVVSPIPSISNVARRMFEDTNSGMVEFSKDF